MDTATNGKEQGSLGNEQVSLGNEQVSLRIGDRPNLNVERVRRDVEKQRESWLRQPI